MKFGLISNPYTRISRLDSSYNMKLTSALGHTGIIAITDSIYDLEKACQEFNSQGIDTVGILGGDGSISIVLTSLYKVYGSRLPKILALHGGTINIVAENLGINKKESPIEILTNFL